MVLNKTFHAENEAKLGEIACEIAKSLEKGGILALNGTLGAGKTALSRALIRILCHNPDLDVPSPTYTLLQIYDAPNTTIWHFDLYRLKHADEVYELGWEDALAPGQIAIIEWPENAGNLLPANHIKIDIKIIDTTTRTIEVTND